MERPSDQQRREGHPASNIVQDCSTMSMEERRNYRSDSDDSYRPDSLGDDIQACLRQQHQPLPDKQRDSKRRERARLNARRMRQRRQEKIAESIQRLKEYRDRVSQLEGELAQLQSALAEARRENAEARRQLLLLGNNNDVALNSKAASLPGQIQYPHEEVLALVHSSTSDPGGHHQGYQLHSQQQPSGTNVAVPVIGPLQAPTVSSPDGAFSTQVEYFIQQYIEVELALHAARFSQTKSDPFQAKSATVPEGSFSQGELATMASWVRTLEGSTTPRAVPPTTTMKSTGTNKKDDTPSNVSHRSLTSLLSPLMAVGGLVDQATQNPFPVSRLETEVKSVVQLRDPAACSRVHDVQSLFLSNHGTGLVSSSTSLSLLVQQQQLTTPNVPDNDVRDNWGNEEGQGSSRDKDEKQKARSDSSYGSINLEHKADHGDETRSVAGGDDETRTSTGAAIVARHRSDPEELAVCHAVTPFSNHSIRTTMLSQQEQQPERDQSTSIQPTLDQLLLWLLHHQPDRRQIPPSSSPPS